MKMANYEIFMFINFFTILILIRSSLCQATSDDRKVHIVYMGSLPKGVYSPLSHHVSMLKKVTGVRHDSSAQNLLITSYKRSFNGFAANLTDLETKRLADMEEVVSVFPSTILQTQTTRSWDFMGLQEKTERNPLVEIDVIVGIIDTGIWPESESFNDQGYGPPPKKWNGSCKGGKNFTCNNKIIGARYYSLATSKNESARDLMGHGTHTASTVAGNNVKDVSFYGIAQGTARGGVPSARIAAYKVCSVSAGCSSADMLAAFDDAIADGVDIISISIGSSYPVGFAQDTIAIGAFHAMEKGILTVNSAGNSVNVGSTASVSPWILSVAASSTDRKIIDKVVLGNGKTLNGNSVNSFSFIDTNFPIIYGKNASKELCRDQFQNGDCVSWCLDSKLAKEKILLCESDDVVSTAAACFTAGAVGAIIKDRFTTDVSSVTPFPASTLTSQDYSVIETYLNSTKEPRATILKSEDIRDPVAPVVASFSSHGPNRLVPEILKPDITAPGVDILAAFPDILPPTDVSEDKRRVKYNIKSGTSMAAPHVAGVAAFVKTFQPDWSPSAIKSSIMTTAWPMNNTQDSHGEFGYGSGHINPINAKAPGLVYETSKDDYLKLLCNIGYNDDKVRLISGDNSTSCPKDSASDKGSAKDINYPSMAYSVASNKHFKVQFHRIVKNVGVENSTYKAVISPTTSKIDVKVVPQVISFKSLNEEKAFDVIVKGEGLKEVEMVSTSLVWSDGTFSVRSPIVIYTKLY